jgi:hypothetical protein
MGSHAWGQQAPPTDDVSAQPSKAPAEPAAPPSLPIAAYPLELLGLLAPRAQRGPVTLTPSIAVSEEYNDNIFSNNQNRQWDFITNFSPALTLFVHRPDYELTAGYSFGAVLYARDTRLNKAFDHQNLVANGVYRLTPGLTLTASDWFALNNSSNLVGSQGFSTGRQESISNTVTPGVNWQMTPLNNLSLSANYGLLRFLGGGTGADSDTYTFQGNLTHAFTPRFSGIVGYGFTYLSLRDQPDSTTHTGTVGFSYPFTQTLSATLTGGASVTQISGDTFVSPAGTASLVQAFSFGSASLHYNQGVAVAGGFGGTNDTLSVTGALTFSTLLRGLFVAISSAYTRSDSLSSKQPEQVDVWAVTLNVGATYQIAQYASLFGGYTFLHQRTGASSSTKIDVDQNVVRFGLQLGYPIDFD